MEGQVACKSSIQICHVNGQHFSLVNISAPSLPVQWIRPYYHLREFVPENSQSLSRVTRLSSFFSVLRKLTEVITNCPNFFNSNQWHSMTRNPLVSPTFLALLWQPSSDQYRATYEPNLGPSAINSAIDPVILTIHHDLSQTANEALTIADLSSYAVSRSSVKMGGWIYYLCDETPGIGIRFPDPSIAPQKGVDPQIRPDIPCSNQGEMR
jgi:hypothetical protein